MKKNLRKVLFLMLCLFTLLSITACGKLSEERVRKKIEQELYKDYGEEFVVDRIGLRSANGVKFYQARIYPKSIIGTEKEDDSYYYTTASIETNIIGGPTGGVADSYGTIKMNDEAEEYLLPKAKELFGERIRLKADVHYKEKRDDYYLRFLENGFEEKLNLVRSDNEKYRMEITLYLYLFDRIDNEEEKEERRKQIFEFIQYLKAEGLFEYLEMGVIFIDERVLAPSYKNYVLELEDGEKVEKEVEGEIILLPTLELRKEMSELLQSEVDKMKEEELIKNMKRIKKSDLSYKGINKDNAQMSTYIYSELLLKNKYSTALSRGLLKQKTYETIYDITIEDEYEYVYH